MGIFKFLITKTLDPMIQSEAQERAPDSPQERARLEGILKEMAGATFDLYDAYSAMAKKPGTGPYYIRKFNGAIDELEQKGSSMIACNDSVPDPRHIEALCKQVEEYYKKQSEFDGERRRSYGDVTPYLTGEKKEDGFCYVEQESWDTVTSAHGTFSCLTTKVIQDRAIQAMQGELPLTDAEKRELGLRINQAILPNYSQSGYARAANAWALDRYEDKINRFEEYAKNYEQMQKEGNMLGIVKNYAAQSYAWLQSQTTDPVADAMVLVRHNLRLQLDGALAIEQFFQERRELMAQVKQENGYDAPAAPDSSHSSSPSVSLRQGGR